MVDRHTQALSFGSQSGVYEAARPGYPRAAVDWVLELLGEKAFTVSEGNRPLRFADIGAGTGKLTRVLREVNDAVVAIDPDPNMLVQLRAVVPGVEAMEGRGEEIPLSDGSCDAVFFGQSWHWTDPLRASHEVGRVLTSDGVLGLLWNSRDVSVPWVRRYAEIIGGSASERLIEADDVRVGAPFTALEHTVVEWSMPMTAGTLRHLVSSRSPYITSEPEEKERVDRHLTVFFEELGLGKDTVIDLPYKTHCYRALKAGGEETSRGFHIEPKVI